MVRILHRRIATLGVMMQYLEEVRNVLSDVLSLGERRHALKADSPLLGSVPELDSMAVVSVITALEDYFGIVVHDDELSATAFETLGRLTLFVDQKLKK